MRERGNRVWSVVLAAGRGRRLASFVRTFCQSDLPKQFVAIDGRRSLLQATVTRIRRFRPSDRIAVVAQEEHRDVAVGQLADFAGARVIAQPRDLGTGPGVLLPLAWIRAQDPNAMVVIHPSDHHFEDPRRFFQSVDVAIRGARSDPDRLVLIGAVADRAETEYGWIRAGKALPDVFGAGISRVEEFVEKPPPALADRLLEGGGLWNTFVVAGRVSTFWDQATAHLPEQVRRFEEYDGEFTGEEGRERLRILYEQMEPADFTRALLERATNLAVVSATGAGWSDVGSPHRAWEFLTRAPLEPDTTSPDVVTWNRAAQRVG